MSSTVRLVCDTGNEAMSTILLIKKLMPLTEQASLSDSTIFSASGLPINKWLIRSHA
ncbi:MAG: hypothetical protein PUC50_13285 [Bacteroidales bacterium]|nr:hypothetical protein [Bacteroidales bacterium]